MSKKLKPGISDLQASVHLKWRTGLGGATAGVNQEGITCFMEIKRLLRDVEEEICERGRREK